MKENTELIRLCISNKVSATGVGALGRGKERSNEKCVRSVILNEQIELIFRRNIKSIFPNGKIPLGCNPPGSSFSMTHPVDVGFGNLVFRKRVACRA